MKLLSFLPSKRTALSQSIQDIKEDFPPAWLRLEGSTVLRFLSVQRTLTLDPRVRQVESRHYVLVGRNGTGKSTLLKAIGDGLIPGIPWSTRILLLGQTRDPELDEQVSHVKIEEETVLQHVVRSDRLRERYKRETKILGEAIEQFSDAMAPVRALRKVVHDRLALQLKEANRIAERRSGARGKLARKELIKVI